jgi:protein O-GlcNAc transferase
VTQRQQVPASQVGKNDPCPCGSGKKFKHCCLHKQAAPMSRSESGVKTIGPDALMKEALAHHESGRFREATALYEQILRDDADHPGALHFSGLAAHQSGETPLAISLMTRSIEMRPRQVSYLFNLGQIFEANGEPLRAAELYRQAAAIEPGSDLAHYRFGIALMNGGDLGGAIASFSQALKIRPESYEAAGGLGTALQKLGRLDQAVVCYRMALSLNPNYVTAHNNLGTVFQDLGHFDEAVASYQKVLQLQPDFAEAHSNLGIALRSRGDYEESVHSCQKAIALSPGDARAYLNLANAYKDLGLLSQAAEGYREAITLAPAYTLAHTNLAETLVEQGRIEEAVLSYQKALEIEPAQGAAYSNLLYLYSFSACISPAKERAFAEGWEKAMLTQDERAAARERASVESRTFASFPRAERKLRLGIVSAELGTHPVAAFLQTFLDHLDRNRFHLTLFPTVGRSGPRAEHFRKLADNYSHLIGVPDVQAAELIRAEQIDILIDTTGHTSNCRLGIFAHRAAPVQCSYIGYWSTTGLTEMDWYITDEDYSAGCDEHFAEGLWRLPHMAHCYTGDETLPESAWVPDPGGTIWLGSFNKYAKMREETLRLWAKVLNTIPNAKLLLEDRAIHENETHERILTKLFEYGVAADRVIFLPPVPGAKFAQHMALYDHLDIALDTIPFNSGTTAFDALWMGVPLVALEGNRIGSRMASSIVRALGHPEWSAQNEEDYVSIVRALASDVEGRKALRRNQRARMTASPLCNGTGLARSLEDAFEEMYERWAKS